MKMKEGLLSVIIHAFLGYLWVLFSERMGSYANAMGSWFMGCLLLAAGTLLFFDVVHRITPFNTYKLTHPTKIIGFVSFLVVVLVLVLL